jgi:uncharacterized protein YkwD
MSVTAIAWDSPPMLLTRRFFIIAGASASLSGCAGIGITSNVPTGTTTPQQLTQAAILSAINEARRINGNHKPLTYNTQLEAAARFQADLMAKKDTLAHDVGYTLRERTNMQNYRGAVGENIAGGQTSLQQAIEGWLNSTGHRATLLSDKFVEFGLAEAHTPLGVKSRYGNYWCFIAGGPVSAWLGGTGVAPPPDDGVQVTGGVAGSLTVSG